MNSSNIYTVPLNEININALKRNNKVNSSIEELAESIKLFGLMQPIVLKGEFGNPPYEVIVGQRRYLAHKLLNEKEINAIFSGQIDDIGATLISLSENMHRVELDHADKAKTITKLYLHFNKDENQVKKATGLSLRTIRDYIKLEEQATAEGLKMLKEGKISKPDLKRVIDIAQGDENKVTTLLSEIGSLSRHEKDRAVKIAKSNSKASVKEIVEEAKKPKIEETVMLNLPMKVTKALRKACEELAIEKEALTMNALTEWLINNNFLVE
jgi:ParB/RepB/Spo0J family partition protein